MIFWAKPNEHMLMHIRTGRGNANGLSNAPAQESPPRDSEGRCHTLSRWQCNDFCKRYSRGSGDKGKAMPNTHPIANDMATLAIRHTLISVQTGLPIYN